MADVVGQNGLHNIRGFLCDLCGKKCDPEAEELNALDCSFGNCPTDCAVYHQDCLEKYLRSTKLEKNRKTGFRCPRGTGKGTKFLDQPCPGKIEKSHPVHIRNDNAKKRRKAQMPVPLPDLRSSRLDPKEKGKSREEEGKKGKERRAREEHPRAAKTGPSKASSKEEQAKQDKLRLQAAAEAMRRDMGLATDSGGVRGSSRRAAQQGQAGEDAKASRAGATRSMPVPIPNAWAVRKPAGSRKVDSGWPPPPPPPPPPGRRPSESQPAPRPGLKLTSQAGRRREAPVGSEPASPPREEAHRLLKAQRKNQRRAEKKAAERNAEKLSAASSEAASTEILDSLAEECAHAVTLFKARRLVQQLQALGFPDWQCVPAVAVHGSNLEDAVTFLLEGRVRSPAHAQQLLPEDAQLPQIDVSPELAWLQACAEECRLDLELLWEQVVRCQGDVEKACQCSMADLGPPGSPSSEQHPGTPPRWRAPEEPPDLQSEFSNLSVAGTSHLQRSLAATLRGLESATLRGLEFAWCEAADVGAGDHWREPTHLGSSGLLGSFQDKSSWNGGSSFLAQSRAAPPPETSYAPYPREETQLVSNIERYNQLLGLQPPAPAQQVQPRYQPPQSGSAFGGRPSSFLSSYVPDHRDVDASKPFSSTAQQARGPTGSGMQHEEHADLDIDNLLTSLIAP